MPLLEYPVQQQTFVEDVHQRLTVKSAPVYPGASRRGAQGRADAGAKTRGAFSRARIRSAIAATAITAKGAYTSDRLTRTTYCNTKISQM